MDDMTLTPELEAFAADAVAAGRYRDMGEVVRAGVSLLRRAEAERTAFIRSLEEAQAEGERDGFYELDEVLTEVDAIIDDEAHARA
jgi:putative addiction module CopG family antidote